MTHRRSRRRPRADEDLGRSGRPRACAAWSTIAPAERRPGAPGSPARRTSTAISRARPPEGHRRGRATTSAMACPATGYAWGRFYDRFDLGKEPNEANRFGWVVEIDPFDPASTPMKRTAHGPLQARGRGRHRQQGRPLRRLPGRRRALRLRLQVRHARRAVDRAEPRPPTATSSTAARSTSRRFDADGTRRLAAARPRRRDRSRAANGFPRPGRRGDPGAAAPPISSARRRWTGPRTSRPTRRRARSTSC